MFEGLQPINTNNQLIIFKSSVLVAGVSGQQPVRAGVHEAALPPQQHRHLLLHRPHTSHQSGEVGTLVTGVNGVKHKPCPILKVSEVTVRNKSFGNPHDMRLSGEQEVLSFRN